MSSFDYEHFEDTSCQVSYEAYFGSTHKDCSEDSCEDSGQTFGLWNLPIRQELSLAEQDDLCQQRLKGEKRKDRQNIALAVSRARFGTTINEQRNFFHEKSRSFALDPTKSRDPLPSAVGDLTLRQLACLRVQAASSPVAPVSAIVPALVVPFVESGCGAMFDIFAEEEDFFVFRETFAVPAVLTSPKAVVTTRPVVVRIPAYDIFSEEDAIFGDMLMAPVVLGAPTVPSVASAVVSPVVAPAVVHDIFTNDDLFGDIFTVPAVFGAPTVPYIPASPAVEAPSLVVPPLVVAAAPVVAKKSSPLSKHALAVRNLELMNKGSAMGALIEIYQEMEADGRVTYPAPALEPVAAPEAADTVVPVVPEPASVSAEVPVTTAVVPDLSSEEEILSGSEKDSTIGSPSSQSSLSDEEDFLSKIHVTPMPTPTKAKKFLSMETPIKVTPMKALTSDTLTTPSPLRLDVPEKSRPDSPAPSPSMKKLMGLGKKTFTPSLEAIEASPIGSPSKELSPPSSPFVRPGNPTPTKAGRGTRTFAPILSPIAYSDSEGEEEEAVSSLSTAESPVPLLKLNGLEVVEDFKNSMNDAIDSIVLTEDPGVSVVETPSLETPLPVIEDPKHKVQELQNHLGISKVALLIPVKPFVVVVEEEEEVEKEDLPEVFVTNTGVMATIAGAYLVAQAIRIAPVPIAVLVGGAAFAAYRVFGKEP